MPATASSASTIVDHGNEFDASVSGNLFKVGPPSGTTVDWITNDYFNYYAGLASQSAVYRNDGSPVDGVEGVFQAGGQYNTYATSAGRAWRKQVYGNFLDTNGDFLFGEDVYGDTGTQGFFMHLSFAGVGVDLHDGTIDDFDPGSANTNAAAGPIIDLFSANTGNVLPNNFVLGVYDLNLQNIENFNSQANQRKKVCNTTQTYANRNNEAVISQWDPAGRASLGNFSAANKVLVDNLVIGSRFIFANDLSGTVFTIKNVTVKRLYNHTAWNRRVVWDDANGEYIEDTSTVHYAWHNFIPEANEYSTPNDDEADLIDAVALLGERLADFGASHNRRTMYVIELDKDPSSLVLPPDELGGTSTSVESTFIEFLTSYIDEDQILLSDNPAIFETEPKENIDLDIYYEASQTYPLVLDNEDNDLPIDNRKGFLIASVNDRVRCTKEEFNIKPVYNISNFVNLQEEPLDIRVADWDGDTVTLSHGLNSLSGVPLPSDPSTLSDKDDLDHQTELLQDHYLQFHKTDGSYVQIKIKEALTISNVGGLYANAPRMITKLRLEPFIYKIGLSYHNCYSFNNGVESNRLRDDFNKPFIKNGVKASTTLQEQYLEDSRTSGLIFSGLYNKNTSLNDLNQFIMAEKITKELEPTYGSIQKLFARDSDLVAFCEDKVVQIAADKDIIFNADGNPQLTASNKVLGQSRPFVGEYGISKNPESFASSSYRAYFTDKQRGAVLRLSMDGLTPISEAGMKDWFRDKFRGNYFNIVGSYDNNKDNYNLTFDSGAAFNPDFNFKSTDASVTVTYKEAVKGWVSFKGFIQESGVSCVNDYFTFRNGDIYRHNTQTGDTNNFYGQDQDSFITAVFNSAATSVKHFNTLNYDGEDGWFCQFINTDLESGSTLGRFKNKENKYFAAIVNDGLAQNSQLPDTSSFGFQGIGIADSIDYNI